MKKLIFLILFFPSIVFAQITPGKYKVNLASYNLNMELAPSTTIIKVSADCRDRTPNCGAQVWQITPFFRMPNVYFLQLVRTGEYLTWHLEEPDKLPTLKQRASNRNINSQAFKIIVNDKGSYQIQPYLTEAGTNDYFLGGETETGSYGYVRVYKSAQLPRNNNSIVNWIFNPPITPLPIQQSSSVVITPPSDNKLEIDIKTGSDNLETRGFQKNPQITVNISNQSPVILENINKGQSWPNNSIKRVTIPLPNNVNLSDLQSITILRDAVNGSRNNIDGAGADNWNIAKLTVTATIKTSGRLVRTVLFNQGGVGSQPLVRIVYEKRNNNNPIEVTSKTFNLSVDLNPMSAPTVTENTNASITAVFGTGGDDLRGGNDNINLSIRFKSGRAPITLNNFNAGRKWNNFSEHSLQKILPNSENIDMNDVSEVVIRHTGGGGIGADNWYLDKFKLTITKGSETKVLIDRVEAPIHYFTGDTRSKTLKILP